MKNLKKYTMALVAAFTILGFFAFKTVEKAVQTSYYWFEYDASGTTLENQTSAPAQSPNPPGECDGDQVNCAKAFTSYSMVSPGVYAPGTPALDENNEEIIRHRNN